jgi:galactokinase
MASPFDTFRVPVRRRFYDPLVAIVRAPGRVNLIGDHTDYQGGICLPMAIDREVQLEIEPGDARRVVVNSDVAGGQAIADAVISVLAGRGQSLRGFAANVTSTVPVGSGLSSSAAFEVAVTLACATASGFELDRRDLALVAQEAEHRATGVPCGVMDQMACVFGERGHALLLDCRSLDVTPVRLPEGLVATVAHSGLPRRLAGSEYAARRDACEAAAARLGVKELRDASLDQVGDDPYARHVVSENARVLAFVDALQSGDLHGAGRLMLESHASLRDDFRVSTPELDALVELAMAQGALGARLTGAGFGGCIVALSTHELDLPASFPVAAAAGAGLIEQEA